MNLNLLHEKLIGAARLDTPSERVPYAFEQRILARIRQEPRWDGLTLWVRALWRAAIPCAAAMLGLAVWTAYTPVPHVPNETADLDTQLETTLMASVSIENELAW
ncbi:MAG: hypothetical protein MUE94_06685 [Verrucomicrobia bacterium]|jgi:hypothetical protein|nr:hypothetical protein [Verrucomicrobiota bacterium]